MPTRSAAALLVAGQILGACLFETDPAEAAIGLLRQANPELAGSEVAIGGCALRIALESRDGGAAQRLSTSYDLSLFDLRTVRIIPQADGRALYVEPRRPVSEALLDRAEEMAALVPDALSGRGGTLTLHAPDGTTTTQERVAGPLGAMSRETLREILEAPGGNLVFRHTVMMKLDGEGAPIAAPHEDGPAFDAFADAVSGLPPPATFAVARSYLAADGPEPVLISGMVTVPKAIQLRLGSLEAARAFGRHLLEQSAAGCRS